MSIVLTPNQKILLEFFDSKAGKENPFERSWEGYHYSSLKRSFGYWTRADYFFKDSDKPTGFWTEGEFCKTWQELQDLGLIITTSDEDRSWSPQYALNRDKIKAALLQIPEINLTITKKEYYFLKNLPVEEQVPCLVENPTNDPTYAYAEYAQYQPLPSYANLNLLRNRMVLLELCNIRQSKFASTPDTYVLTPLQAERLNRIPVKTSRPKTKYKTDEERLEARRSQKRQWWQKHRAK